MTLTVSKAFSKKWEPIIFPDQNAHQIVTHCGYKDFSLQ